MRIRYRGLAACGRIACPNCRDACNASASSDDTLVLGRIRTRQELGEVPLHRICLHLSLSEEPRDAVLRKVPVPYPLNIRAMSYAHGARLEQTFIVSYYVSC